MYSNYTLRLAYLCTSCIFFPVVLAPRQRSHLCSCFTVHSSGICRGKIAPGTSSCLSFTFSDFFLSITSTILRSCYAKTLLSLLQSALRSAMFVSTRVPPNKPIRACADTFDPRLSLFFKVSYSRKSMKKNSTRTFPNLQKNLQKMHSTLSLHIKNNHSKMATIDLNELQIYM